jgi:hypothetical protein
MTALVDPHMSLVPLPAAPGLSDYCQFAAVEIPQGSEAIAAYQGYIRPFSDDQAALHFLRAIENNLPVEVTGGRLYVDASHLPRHPFEEFLIDMAVPLTTLVLEFEGGEHPRSFLIDPRMRPRLNRPSHIRTDKSLMIDGQSHPALCIYSGSLFRFTSSRSRLEQFLDQTATYLAKYLIWLRTRMLFRPLGSWTRQFVYRRKPLEPVTEFDLALSRDVYWDGYWPGPSAPMGPPQHLATIKREDECWCWSGRRYGECCRPRDLELNKKLRLSAG